MGAVLHGPGDGERIAAGSGSEILIKATSEDTGGSVPPGIAHTFSNPSDRPVRFLNLNTPGGFERYMRDLGEAAKTGPLTPEVMGPIASRYDFELA
jgi:oxalate decarboxylase/phosphoglucose isomerase-like protein (cupin superfamily)